MFKNNVPVKLDFDGVDLDKTLERLNDPLILLEKYDRLNLSQSNSNTHIPNDTIKSLAQKLASNETITELNLHGSYIYDAGAKHIANALKANKTITKLDVSFCKIGEKGAQELIQSLENNQSLTYLDISGNNPINDVNGGQDFKQTFATIIEINKTLEELILPTNFIDEDLFIELEEILDDSSNDLLGLLTDEQ